MSLISKITLVLITITAFVFLGLLFSGNFEYSEKARSLIVPLATIFYLVTKKGNYNLCFLLFLATNSFSEILYLFYNFFTDDFVYYTVNILNLISYIFLMITMFMQTNFLSVLSKYAFHLLILIVLSVLGVIYFSSILDEELELDMVLEVIYNIVLMSMLSVSVLMFSIRSTSKAMYFLLGVVFLVIAEFVTTAYYNLGYNPTLEYIYAVFFLLAFYFLLYQSFEKHEDFNLETN